ncbi:hypothetical protein JCM10213_003926 [Rhodosporidiobolus nylandii]
MSHAGEIPTEEAGEAVNVVKADAAKSRFLDLPDEILTLVLEQAHVSVAEESESFGTDLTNVCVNKRVAGLAQAVWHAQLGNGEDLVGQQNILVTVLARPDIAAQLRDIYYAVDPVHHRYDATILSRLPALHTLHLAFPHPDGAFDLGNRLPTHVTDTLCSFPSLTSLTISSDEPFELQDPTFDLGAAVPHLRRLQLEAPPSPGVRRLVDTAPSVKHLSVQVDYANSSMLETAPFSELRSLTIGSPCGTLAGSTALALTKGLLKAGKAEPNMPAPSLPLQQLLLRAGDEYPTAEEQHLVDTFDVAVIHSLLGRLDKSGLKHLVIWTTTEWLDYQIEMPSVERLTLAGASLEYAPSLFELAVALRRFPNLHYLYLDHVSFNKIEPRPGRILPPYDSSEFVLLFPHLPALLLILRKSPVLHVCWQTDWRGIKFEWNRLNREEEFEIETWAADKPL